MNLQIEIPVQIYQYLIEHYLLQQIEILLVVLLLMMMQMFNLDMLSLIQSVQEELRDSFSISAYKSEKQVTDD